MRNLIFVLKIPVAKVSKRQEIYRNILELIQVNISLILCLVLQDSNSFKNLVNFLKFCLQESALLNAMSQDVIDLSQRLTFGKCMSGLTQESGHMSALSQVVEEHLHLPPISKITCAFIQERNHMSAQLR